MYFRLGLSKINFQEDPQSWSVYSAKPFLLFPDSRSQRRRVSQRNCFKEARGVSLNHRQWITSVPWGSSFFFEFLKMSKIFSRIAGFFSNRIQVGIDKAGNRYFSRKEEIDGIMKEKRWVVFKGEKDPTSIPVEWICWLNGQRKKAPTPGEMAELEARREQVRQNVARLKEEEQRNSKEGGVRKGINTGKVGGPDLQSFIRQFPGSSEEGGKVNGPLDEKEESGKSEETRGRQEEEISKSSEPVGSGATFRPGTWQPPA